MKSRRHIDRITRDLLILGHPRSGTGYMAQLLSALELPVGHERMKDRGISSWMFAADADEVPYTLDGSVPSQYQFNRVIHVVRSPENVISSMAFASLPDERTTRYMGRFISLDRSQDVVAQAVETYIGWNKLIASRCPDALVRVEQAAEELPPLLQRWGLIARVPQSGEILLPSTDYNKREHRRLTWQEIRNAVDEGLFAQLVDLARDFGYEPDETQAAPRLRSSGASSTESIRTAQQHRNSKCIVLVPSHGGIEPGCERVLQQLEKRGYSVRRIFGMAAIDQARNRMATDALSEGYEELLWVDSDMVFHPDAVETLRAHDLPLVGTIAAKKGSRALSCEFLPGTKSIVFGRGGGLVELRYVGTGVLLTHRRVYQAIQEKLKLPLCNQNRGIPVVPYFMPLLVPDGDGQWYLGEDYAFCERARRSGYQVFADTTIRIHHLGTYRYSWEDAGSDVKRYATYHYTLT